MLNTQSIPNIPRRGCCPVEQILRTRQDPAVA
jgi:hypothetical protein